MSETTEQRSMTMTETIGDILGRQLPQFERVRQYIETELADNETALRTKLKAKDAEIASITEQRDKAWACAEHREHNINTEKRLEAKINAKEEECEGLHRALDAVQDLMDESDGVAGLHRNGDLAPWGELLEGGRFEEWLIAYSQALTRKPTTAEDLNHALEDDMPTEMLAKATAPQRAEIKKGVIKQSEDQ